MLGGAGPFLAPIQSMAGIRKAVDVGCGTGIATVEMAKLFPSATVYGLDLSRVPEAVVELAPENVTWATGNVLDVDEHLKPTDDTGVDAIFAPSSLDYVFSRLLVLGLDNWPRYCKTAAGALKSGGIIEIQDVDWPFFRVATSEQPSSDWEWHQQTVSAMDRAGMSTRAGSGAAALLEAAGLEIVSVQTFEFSWVPTPTAPRSRALGRYLQDKFVPQFPALLRKMLGREGIVGAELERLTKQALRDLSSEEGLYQRYTVTVARKP